MPSPRSHIYRLVLVLVIGVGGFLLVKDFFKPDSWDDQAWYRREALPRLQQQSPLFGGNESCQSAACHAVPEKDHDEKFGLLKDATHDGLACEGCHGPVGEHARDGQELGDPRVIRESSLCLDCHDQRMGRAERVAQFSETFEKHERKKVTRESECIECHDPHAPSDKKQVVAVATPAAEPSSSAESATSTALVGLANTCNSCHGSNGASAGAMMPTISGQPLEYLNNILLQFKTGERPSTAMGRLLAGYNDAELAALAEFYAQQAWVTGPQELDAELVKAGAELHEEHCEECHEEAGKIGIEDTPRLAGQWRAFLEQELQKYQDKKIGMPHRRMGRTARKLSPDDVLAVAHFYASQED